ncbi:putative bifunctional diguanylate cyclase/phosphodiesterase [Herminiimonas aquatilis]|uniref:Bifunctional diguanylate cyclase/phosphodiesterase n=1 Tax=Herminiimonas aquatilis TaxID=345342 RepID=A0ABW2J1X5_9BURK
MCSYELKNERSFFAFLEKIEKLEVEINLLYDQMPFGSYSLADDGTFSSVDSHVSNWLASSPEELIGKKKLGDFLTSNSQEKLKAEFALAAHSEFSGVELELLSKEGATRHVSLSTSGLRDAAGQLLSCRYIMFDMTPNKQAQEKLRIAATALESVAGICITDPDGIILQVNKTFTRLTGFTAQELRGQNVQLLSTQSAEQETYKLIFESILTNGRWQGEIRERRKDGHPFVGWLNISSIKPDKKTVSYYVGFLYDITHSSAQEEIKRLAFYDSLTQLPNRLHLENRLIRVLARLPQSGLRGALLFIDLDNFKTINDTKGHAAGDQLLIEIGERLRRSVRHEDTVARLGGDEFVVLVSDLNASEVEAARQAMAIGREILTSLAQPYQFLDCEFACTASIGVCMFDGGESPRELLQNADMAMYQAKKGGRNSLCFFNEEMQIAVAAYSKLEQELRCALREHQLEVYFEPQLNSDGKIIAAEALVRWRNPERGMILPNDFIKIAEDTGLIMGIGLFVLQTACEQLKAWERDPRTSDLQIAVNVSARQFLQADFVSLLIDVIAASGINPALLKLELTESMMHDIDATSEKMESIKKMGVSFAMDDFGTGYSSLSSLTKLPLNQLKIDQSFVHNMLLKTSDTIVVQTIIAMAHSLNLEVIAEGVETEEQKVFLLSNGCTLFQGYFFSGPLSIAEFEALLFRQTSPHTS